MVCLIQIDRLSFQKLAKVAQTKKQMDRSNRLACGYSIIRAADIHRFLGLSMLSQVAGPTPPYKQLLYIVLIAVAWSGVFMGPAISGVLVGVVSSGTLAEPAALGPLADTT